MACDSDARRRADKVEANRHGFVRSATTSLICLLVGCAVQPSNNTPTRRPAEIRADIVRALPPTTRDREGWATDITAAFAALDIEPTHSNLCAALAVIGQESNFTEDPAVPNLGRIARAEIDRRAEQHDIPQLVVRAALAVHSSNGKSYSDRIATVRTERELSLVYEDLISRVPLGQPAVRRFESGEDGRTDAGQRCVRGKPCARAFLSISDGRIDPP